MQVHPTTSVFLLAGLGLSSILFPSTESSRIGFETSPYSQADVDSLVRALDGVGLPAWFLRAIPVLSPGSSNPPSWIVEVYLKPDQADSHLRRGRVHTYYKPPSHESGNKFGWERSPTPSFYAQVPKPGRTLPTQLSRPTDGEMPFDVPAGLPDEDLRAIADLAWAPFSMLEILERSDRGVQICEENFGPTRQILQMSNERPDKAEVLMLGGCAYGLERQGGKWKVTSVGVFGS